MTFWYINSLCVYIYTHTFVCIRGWQKEQELSILGAHLHTLPIAKQWVLLGLLKE